MNLAEAATRRERVRRVMPTEAKAPQPRATQLKNAFCRLTPELSRAERDGWEPVLPAYPEVSTKPRHGVGLNDLLGGPDAGENEALTDLPRTEAGMLERVPVKFLPAVTEATASGADKPTASQSLQPKPVSATHAMCERARQT